MESPIAPCLRPSFSPTSIHLPAPSPPPAVVDALIQQMATLMDRVQYVISPKAQENLRKSMFALCSAMQEVSGLLILGSCFLTMLHARDHSNFTFFMPDFNMRFKHHALAGWYGRRADGRGRAPRLLLHRLLFGGARQGRHCRPLPG